MPYPKYPISLQEKHIGSSLSFLSSKRCYLTSSSRSDLKLRARSITWDLCTPTATAWSTAWWAVRFFRLVESLCADWSLVNFGEWFQDRRVYLLQSGSDEREQVQSAHPQRRRYNFCKPMRVSGMYRKAIPHLSDDVHREQPSEFHRADLSWRISSGDRC